MDWAARNSSPPIICGLTPRVVLPDETPPRDRAMTRDECAVVLRELWRGAPTRARDGSITRSPARTRYAARLFWLMLYTLVAGPVARESGYCVTTTQIALHTRSRCTCAIKRCTANSSLKWAGAKSSGWAALNSASFPRSTPCRRAKADGRATSALERRRNASGSSQRFGLISLALKSERRPGVNRAGVSLSR